MDTFVATQKYVQTTPRKLRLVADAAKKLSPMAAIEVLPYSNKRAALPLLKTIKTAVANAKQTGVDETKLVFSEIQITQGPVLGRGNPVSRGQFHPIKRRMSHIRVVVKEGVMKNSKKVSAKSETKEVNEVTEKQK